MSLNWFPLYHGDYIRDTGDLSHGEHGIYMLLLMAFFARGPLPDDLNRLCRMAAGAPPEDVRQILERYWILTAAGWINARMESIRQEQIESHARRVEAGREGGKARARTLIQGEAQALIHSDPSNATAMLNDCSSNQNQNQNQKKEKTPLGENSPNFAPAPVDKIPLGKIVDLYHEVLPELPRVEKLTKTREGYLKQRWRQDLPSLEHWRHFFEFVRESDFLMGRARPSPGRPPFIANLEWLTKEGNFAKIAEEKYHHG